VPDADPPPASAPTRWAATAAPRGDAYDRRWDELAAAGHDPHGEAAFVMGLSPRTVLDAGCGTGRVARELARRGVHVVGVDIDADMLATAARKSPEIEWHQADLRTLDLAPNTTGVAPPFDVAVLAGNVMIFLAPGTEAEVLRRISAHVAPGGHVVAGFQLLAGRLELERYDADADAVGLRLVARFATWDGQAFDPAHADYAVSVHRRELP
jgi:SAM-dependent methyltransferase